MIAPISNSRPTCMAAIDSLEDAPEMIAEISARLEHDFLAVADAIESVTTKGESLLRATTQLHDLALGKQGGQSAVTAASDLLREPVRFLESSGLRTDTVIGLLNDYYTRLERTLAWETESRRTLAPLAYVQTLFRIEAARLETSLSRMLLALVADIDVLQRRLEDVFGEKFRELHETHDVLGALVTSLNTQARLHTDTSRRRGSEINTAITALTDAIESSAQREITLTTLTEDIAQQTSGLVMAVQFQDIVTQKLAHVAAACGDIIECRAEIAESGDAEVIASHLAFVEYTARVILAQLDAAHTEIVDSEARIDAAVDGIVLKMRALEHECVAMRQVDTVSAEPDGFVQLMLDAIHQVRGLLRSGSALVNETALIVHPIAGTAANVTQRMNQLADGMQLVGLNAEVQAAHVGTGGLEVLSAQTSEIARQTRHVSDNVADDMHALMSALNEVVQILGDLKVEGLTSSTMLDADAGAVEALLHAFRDRALQCLEDVSAQALSLASALGPILQRPRSGEIFSDGVTHLRALARDVVDELEREAVLSDVTVDLDAITSVVRARYTMASERRIHDATIRHMTSGPRRTQRAGPIELFDGSDEESVVAVKDNAGNSYDDTPVTVSHEISMEKSASGASGNDVDLWL